MKIFNTLTRKKEEFVPIEPGKVKMYSCGPTVYNYFHIGNARPFIVFDTLRTYLEYLGYDVTFVQNFTDIDDKMIKKANEEGTTVKEVAERYIAEYFVDAKGLGIRPATVHPKATENIDAIIEIVEKLIATGHAYESQGDVYFATKSFEGYGKLSHQPLEELASGARVAVGEVKRDPMDFALWKAQKPGEPAWESPWGMGRPGWHIECSAMANRYLGKSIDIHSGGLDLTFPHHENEIAQSECANGCTFANYWMHNGFINVDNQKMSKSLGNFFTVREIAEQFPYEVVRFFMLSAHYRSPINFSRDLIESAQNALERLYTCRNNLRFLTDTLSEGEGADTQAMESYRQKFKDAMDDDLNTADAISVLFELVRFVNTEAPKTKKEAADWLALLTELSDVLGILKQEEASLDEEVEALIEERTQARKEKNWKRADEIRDQLKAMGVVLEDTPQGVKWHRE